MFKSEDIIGDIVFISFNNKDCLKDVGIVAQDIEKILPEAVADRVDGTKGVKYEQIIPLLVEAIKDLKSQLDSK